MEPTTVSAPIIDTQSFMQKVYSWMAGGLFATAVTAYLTVSSGPFLSFLIQNIFVFYILLIAELGLVIYLSAKARTLSTDIASVLFALYAILNGITLSLLLLIYTPASIASAFVSTAGMFGLMSFYGATTKKDLSTIGNIALMGLLGIILASIISFFLGNTLVELTINVLGVIVFATLTAYDAQKIKEMRVPPVIGALSLYLDFINIFIRLLQLGGRRRS